MDALAATGQTDLQAALASSGADLPTATATAAAQTDLHAVLASSGADMSMATGGCLWFPDLMVADPYNILPVALSTIFFVNVMPKSLAGWRRVLGVDSTPVSALDPVEKWRLRLRRAMLLFSVAVGPLSMGLPAAIHLYWISSAVLGILQTNIVSWLMPLPKIAPPAKRRAPVLMLPTREKTEKLKEQS